MARSWEGDQSWQRLKNKALVRMGLIATCWQADLQRALRLHRQMAPLVALGHS